MAEKQTKFIFVTGGVVSGLGKGITAASLGRLLKCRGLKVASQKLDPYVNVDPGTMSPLQHGEVFVTDDGTETDLDLGHYERFIDENLNKYSNLTTGKVYWNVLNKERQGAYLGQTVQIIPHITNEIKSYIYNLASSTEADVVITEIGGTTGDIESQPFLEAIRQVGLEHENFQTGGPAAARVVRYAAVCQLQDRCGKGGRRQERQEQSQRRQACTVHRASPLLGCQKPL